MTLLRWLRHPTMRKDQAARTRHAEVLRPVALRLLPAAETTTRPQARTNKPHAVQRLPGAVATAVLVADQRCQAGVVEIAALDVVPACQVVAAVLAVDRRCPVVAVADLPAVNPAAAVVLVLAERLRSRVHRLGPKTLHSGPQSTSEIRYVNAMQKLKTPLSGSVRTNQTTRLPAYWLKCWPC